VVPGKHTTRKGWLTKDFQYPQSPYTCDIDARIWDARDGSRLTLRDMARKVAWYFRRGIRRYADPFTVRHLFAILSGRAASLLELPDRPAAYDDVGRLCAWGTVLPGLEPLARGTLPSPSAHRGHDVGYDTFIAQRERDVVLPEERENAVAQPSPVSELDRDPEIGWNSSNELDQRRKLAGLKVRAHLHKVNTEALRKSTPKFWERIACRSGRTFRSTDRSRRSGFSARWFWES
jgi:hypothetical protein